ncbi:hypothetical protein I317_07042 [Kwoniella heveanensis CBS 569]|nr:hypothetical protein I317_07042 [Kwoniella heveanensis CBS 569]
MSANLEDSLGSALETSFNLPPPPAPPAKGVEDPHAPTAIPSETVAASSSEPVEGADTWKETLDGYLAEWQAESSVARDKAEKTRKKIADEHAAKAKAEKDRIAAEKRAKADKEKAEKDKIRLQLELEEGVNASTSGTAGLSRAEREKKVQEAWELVKGHESKSKADKEAKAGQERTAETDGRGTTEQDVKAGQVKIGQGQQTYKPRSYDPTTSTDPIPPVFQDPVPSAGASAPAESTTLSRHSATSQAWEDVSGASGSGSGSGENVSPPQSSSEDSDIVNINLPHSSSASNKPNQPQGQGQPPHQPPSLTLSLFTMPSSLSVSRVLAVVGINLVLPFINGVFLGFGEIFAREAVRVGRAVWRGERALFGFGRGGAAGFGGRGTGGVGLSGGF